MNRIVGLIVALLVLSAFFWLVESLFAANPRQPRLLRRAAIQTDVAYWFVTPLVTRSNWQVGLALILFLIYRENPTQIRERLLARASGRVRRSKSSSPRSIGRAPRSRLRGRCRTA